MEQLGMLQKSYYKKTQLRPTSQHVNAHTKNEEWKKMSDFFH